MTKPISIRVGDVVEFRYATGIITNPTSHAQWKTTFAVVEKIEDVGAIFDPDEAVYVHGKCSDALGNAVPLLRNDVMIETCVFTLADVVRVVTITDAN